VVDRRLDDDTGGAIVAAWFDGLGQVFAAALLDHYRETLSEIRQIGHLTDAGRRQ
jgi:hypothetical protein